MDIKPIVSALGRHRVAATLITLEIALACAVLCNALFLVSGRVGLMRINSGVDESSLATVVLDGCDDCKPADVNARALAALRAIPGVRSAGVVNAVPFGQRVGSAGITLDREGKHRGGVPHFYVFGPEAIATMNLRPVQGRDFTAGDFQPFDNFMPKDAQVWITQAFAAHLWPGESALGKEFWMVDYHFRVAGVLAHFAQPTPGRSQGGVAASEWSVIVPGANDSQFGTYVLRAEAMDMPQVMQAARKAVQRAVPEAMIDQTQSRSLPELRESYFRNDRAMAWLLVAVIAAMLLVTALGIVGLASFWVQQRTRQIGVRRALGATKGQILRYFQVENFLLTTGGIVLGLLLAFAINQLLMRHYELQRLPWQYLPLGALILWVLGQLSVWWPAHRATAIPPVIATRSA
jgi:putative ABC transport system permease protein